MRTSGVYGIRSVSYTYSTCHPVRRDWAGSDLMELFRNTNFDFLGKKWPFIIASLVLTVAGLVSLAMKGGPRYGIDFKGGTLMTVKFQTPRR